MIVTREWTEDGISAFVENLRQSLVRSVANKKLDVSVGIEGLSKEVVNDGVVVDLVNQGAVYTITIAAKE